MLQQKMPKLSQNNRPLHKHSVYIDHRGGAQDNEAKQSRSEIQRKETRKGMKKTQNFIFKKALVMLMAVIMVFTYVPSMAWAENLEDGSAAEILSQDAQEQLTQEETIHVQQEKNQTAETFKGTAEHGYVNHISFGDQSDTMENVALEKAMKYDFNTETTEYSFTVPDFAALKMQWSLKEGFNAEAGLKAAIAYYDEESGTWKTLAENRGAYTGLTGISLGYYDETKRYDKPVLLRFAVGPTKMVGTNPKVDIEQADIYYYSITREASLANISAGEDYPLSPAFDPYERTEYFVYGSFVADTEINLTLYRGHDVPEKKNEVYVNGEKAEFSVYSYNFTSKYLELWQDQKGRKYAKIEVKRPSEDGESLISGRTYRVYFLNEQKVKFTKQPIGGTFEPKAGQTTTVSVAVDVPEGATAQYKWYGSKYNGKTGTWTKFNTMIVDKATYTTADLLVKTNNPLQFRCYCLVTLTIDGVDYSAKSETAEVEVVKVGRISGPNMGENSVMIPRTYYQDENAAQLTATFSPIDDGVETTMQWYVSENEDGSDAKELQSEKIKGSVGYGCNGAVTPDTSKVGTFYYYCIGTCTLTEDGVITATETTDSRDVVGIVKIEVKPIGVKLNGDGSKFHPYEIEDLDDLKEVQRAVNEDGVTFANRYLRLIAEKITLPKDWEGLGRNDASKWAPYVSGFMPFSGNLDGDNHLIEMEPGCRGLIKIARDAVVKDLNLYGEEITASALVTDLSVDYGLDRTYATGCPSPITADNVTLKSGSKTRESGLVGGSSSSGANTVIIRNCTIEDGVIIGYDKSVQNIGSFINYLNGIIINSTSAADVYGTSGVGGLAGRKGQSMGLCQVLNSSFTGTITATLDEVGGIMGAGYESESAPNTPAVSIINCYVDADIRGKDKIGGIFGSEGGVIFCWENGVGSIDNNSFYGTIKATKENAQYVGGTVGFLRSFNKNQGIDTNYYLDTCGTDKGVGIIQKIYTSGSGAVEKDFDVEKHCIKARADAFKNGTVLKGLQAGKRSYKNWKQGESYPIHSGEKVLYAIELSGNYDTTYTTGDKLDTEHVIITAKYSDGTTATIPSSEATFTGYNPNVRGVQTITVTYGAATATFEVTVLYPTAAPITVFFTLRGDTKHGEPNETTGTHTLKEDNLDVWVERTEVPITNNETVYDAMKKVFKDNGITWEESYGLGTVYIESLTRKVEKDGKTVKETLGEFDNGNLSGWMYTLNGHHPNLGVAQQFLNGGEEIIFHYTDDYTVEEGSEHWNTSGGVVEEVKDVTTDTKTGTTTAPTDVKVSEKTNADGTKTKVADVKVSADNQKEILKQAKEKKSNEIILVVPSKEVGDAAKADVTLEKSFIDSIVKDTDAKLTIRTPFGDKTYTQEELKAMSDAATGSTITVAIEKAEQPTDDAAVNIAKAKSIVKDLKLTARSSKTTKKNIKAVLKSDAKVKASIKELKDLGFTVKYRFYRSTKKAASYKSTVTKKTAAYTNTSGKKGTKYFYKLQVRVYDENGKLVAKTALKQCKYASRTWSK